MTTILNKIIAEKQKEVLKLLQLQLPEEIQVQRPNLFDRFYKASKLQIITEIKRASPSKGMINSDVEPTEQAKLYTSAGAACISILTDTPFFKGTFEDLRNVAQVVNTPLLCKDFIIDPIQIDFAKANGASVILLIVSALPKEKIFELFEYATKKGLEILVEVHDVAELQVALALGAKLIGVNNRNLKTFEVTLTQTETIARHFPFHEERVLISESGIVTTTDAQTVSQAGASAILVGETFMRSDNIRETFQQLQVKKEVSAHD